jgi:hypothetical protein
VENIFGGSALFCVDSLFTQERAEAIPMQEAVLKVIYARHCEYLL